jgi:GNAT superfamily N-acetyltransferase
VREVEFRVYRKLGEADAAAYAAHLARLRPEDRAFRFGNGVTPAPVRFPGEALMIGAFERGKLCGVGELHFMGDGRARGAEAAFTVAADHQDSGLGKGLFIRILWAARNRGVRRLLLLCHAGNRRMLHLAASAGAVLEHQAGEVWASIELPPSTPVSVMLERSDDALALVAGASRACAGIASTVLERGLPAGAG